MGPSPYRAPIIALILGILPSFIFIGTKASTTVNGVVTSASSINILGLILAGIGAVMMVSYLLRGPQNRTPATMVLAVVALAVCAAQIANAVGVIDLNY